MSKIIALGEILVEIIADKTDQPFNKTGLFRGPFASGAPAIFINQAAKCNSSTTIISAVGNDGFGELNLNKLKEDGTNISQVKIVEEKSTGVAFVSYYSNGDRDFIYHMENSACGNLSKNDVIESTFEDCSYLHIMGSSIFNDKMYFAIMKSITLAKANNAKISFDPNIRKEVVNDKKKKNQLISILNESHVVLASEGELEFLLDLTEEEAIENLIGRIEVLVVKRGKKGAELFTKDRTYFSPAIEVEEIDPTGAGDCFGGTFIACLNQGIELEKTLKLSTIAGGLAVTELGPMEGNNSLEYLLEYMKANYKGTRELKS